MVAVFDMQAGMSFGIVYAVSVVQVPTSGATHVCFTFHKQPPCPPAGGQPRGENQDRIEFLAHARNMALEPVFPAPVAGEAFGEHRNVTVNMRLLGAADTAAADAAAAASEGSEVGGAAAGGGGESWTPDRVVFINDVYFCVRDVVRCATWQEGRIGLGACCC